MQTAKIIRHRHKYHHYMNDDLKSVKEETHYKIQFSDPAELDKFCEWIEKYKGKYDYDREHSCQRGRMPKIKLFKEDVCWCDVMEYYILHIAGFSYHSSIHPYKGEVYIK
jgi:hypothetical protein